MMKEKRAEELVRDYLKEPGHSVVKGIDADIEVRRGARVTRVAEVKGDQVNLSGRNPGGVNDPALSNSFLKGLGQIVVAMTRNRGARASLAVTRMYEGIVEKYADVLIRQKISVLWVSPRGKIDEDDLRHFRPPFYETGHGHPDGLYACGQARFRVSDGRLEWVAIDGVRKAQAMSFAELCNLLKVRHRGDSAPRALSRRSTRVRRIAGEKGAGKMRSE